ncbi:hypothetical protein ACHAQH_006364 [Verticillium albo-atrum]
MELSSRGTAFADPANNLPMTDVVANFWHAESNPGGYISLGSAENFAINSHALTTGDGFSGSKALRTAIAGYVNPHFKPATPVESQHVSATSGVGLAAEALAFSLLDRGDGVLLGHPYYGQFPADMATRAERDYSDAHNNPFSSDAIEVYEQVLVKSNKSGIPIKAVILCNPHNPLGRCYPPETLSSYMRFCEKYSLHLICDEVYAGSTWDNPDFPDAPDFTSILSLDPTSLIDPSRIHIAWGMSKEFGSNGTRLGCVISSPSDILATLILTSPSFLASFFPTNRKRLAAAHGTITAVLESHGISYAKGANAGFFLWVNLLPDATWEEEAQLDKVLLRHKVYLASGKSFGSEKPGWFRVIFSHEKVYLQEGLERIITALKAFKEGL